MTDYISVGAWGRQLAQLLLIVTCCFAMAPLAWVEDVASSSDMTIIHAGQLLDLPGTPSRGPSSIIISNGMIVEIRDGYVDFPDAKVIDLTDKFVLPGLIDTHVHISIEYSPSLIGSFPQRSPASFALDGTAFAMNTLQAGFTTVRDLGSPSKVAFDLRDAIESNRIAGPTIVASGQMISTTAGHADLRGFNERSRASVFAGHLGITCDGADECMKRVREQVRDGADVIKLAVTGGVLTESKGGLAQQMSIDEIAAIVAVAKQHGLAVAAHAHGSDGIQVALKAGVGSIEHGSYLEQSNVELFRTSEAYLVPTLLAVTTAAEQARRGLLPPLISAKALNAERAANRAVEIAVLNRIPIAFGTDSGISKHGDNAGEFSLLVAAGLSPSEAISSATTNASALLGRADKIGSLEPGKDADIIAVDGDPIQDILSLKSINFVMRRGVVHRLSGEPIMVVSSVGAAGSASTKFE